MRIYVQLVVLGLVIISCAPKPNGDRMDESRTTDHHIRELVDTPYVGIEEIKAPDGLMITFERKHLDYNQPTIIMCHQTDWSRGEYSTSADSFYRLGFNCILMDQRSGREVNGVENETAKRARAQGKSQNFEDAEQDIEAMVDWVNDTYYGDIILMGSSYSASLVLKVASAKPDIIDQVIAFSPGQYFEDFDMLDVVSGVSMPCFLTSSKEEASSVQEIFSAIPSAKKIQFIPESNGDHGSRVLWPNNEENVEYWRAVKRFVGR